MPAAFGTTKTLRRAEGVLGSFKVKLASRYIDNNVIEKEKVFAPKRVIVLGSRGVSRRRRRASTSTPFPRPSCCAALTRLICLLRTLCITTVCKIQFEPGRLFAVRILPTRPLVPLSPRARSWLIPLCLCLIQNLPPPMS